MLMFLELSFGAFGGVLRITSRWIAEHEPCSVYRIFAIERGHLLLSVQCAMVCEHVSNVHIVCSTFFLVAVVQFRFE